MNVQQAERFQQLLIEACDKHLEDGGKIIHRMFFEKDSNGACPLYCLFGRDTIIGMAKKLGQLVGGTHNEDEMWAFTIAFDGSFDIHQWLGNPIADHQKKYVSAILIGKALRAKYLKE